MVMMMKTRPAWAAPAAAGRPPWDDAKGTLPALRLAQAQVGPETGGHLNAAPRTNDSTRIARNR